MNRSDPQEGFSVSLRRLFNTPAEGKDPTCDLLASGRTIWPHGGGRTTGHRRTTGPSVSSVIWATVQPGRNRGKEPRERARKKVGLLSEHPAGRDWRSLFGLVFFSGNILSEHLTSSVTLLQQHSEMRLLMCPADVTYMLRGNVWILL